MSLSKTLYSERTYGRYEGTIVPSNNLSKNLMPYLPTYYQNSTIMWLLQKVLGKELAHYEYMIDQLIGEFFIDTATESLDRIEHEIGIKTDLTKDYESRRELIKAKLRGTGTVTKTMIKEIAQVFSGAEVDVIEQPNNYFFKVKFVGTKGIPKNMDLFIQTLENIKPAHLAYALEYVYMWWNQFDSYNKTWNQWDALNLTWDQYEVYGE